MLKIKINFKLFFTIVLLVFSGGISACGARNLSSAKNRPQQSVPFKLATKEKTAISQNLESAQPVQLEYGDLWKQTKSEYVILPVGYQVKSNKRKLDSASASYSASKSSILRGQSLSAVNLIFHGHQNNSTHLLLEQNAFITEFDYLVDSQVTVAELKPGVVASSCQPPAKTAAEHSFHQLMVYKIIERDTNQNQVLDLGDENKGYLSDLTGKNLRSLTPDLTQLTQWHCDYQRNQLLLFVRELNLQAQKNEIKPLVLYLYHLPTNKLTRITPSTSNLENWKINLKEGWMYLYSRLDGNEDRRYNSADETRVIKYNLNTKQTIEINDQQIRESLEQ